MASDDPDIRKAAASKASLTRLVERDPAEWKDLTQAAREANWQRYLELADPDMVLDEKERWRRAEALRKRHMADLALKSAQKRRDNMIEAARARVLDRTASAKDEKTAALKTSAEQSYNGG